MMLSRQQFPDDFDQLKTVTIELPAAEGESESTCPTSMADILDHLAHECPGGEFAGGQSTIDFELQFSRTADVNGTKYWLWLFRDEEDAESFVLVGRGETRSLVYDETFGLTPEQIIVAQHFDID